MEWKTVGCFKTSDFCANHMMTLLRTSRSIRPFKKSLGKTTEISVYFEISKKVLLVSLKKYKQMTEECFQFAVTNQEHPYLSNSLGEPTSYFSNIVIKLTSSSTADPHPQTRARSLPVPKGITPTQTFSACLNNSSELVVFDYVNLFILIP